MTSQTESMQAAEIDMDKLQKLSNIAVSVGNVERSVALSLINMLDSGSAAQMEQAKIATQTLGLVHAYCYNFTAMIGQLDNKRKFLVEQHLGGIRKHSIATLTKSKEREACIFLSEQEFLDLFNFSEIHLRITAVSNCTQKCRDLVDLSPYMKHLDHLVSLVRRLLCSAEWQPNSSRLKQRTLELLHLLLCRFGRCFGPCACSLIPTLATLFGDDDKDVRRLAVLAVDEIGRRVSASTLFGHLLADCYIAHVKWQVRLHVLRAIVQCAILHMWAVDVTRAATAIYPLLWDDHQSVVDMCVETVFVLHRVDPAANVVQLLSTLHSTHTTTHGSPSPDKRTAVWNRINRRLQTPCNNSQPLLTDPPITLLHSMLRGTAEGGGHREREVSRNESKLKHLRLRHRTPATRQRNQNPRNASDGDVSTLRTTSAPMAMGSADSVPPRHTITQVKSPIDTTTFDLHHQLDATLDVDLNHGQTSVQTRQLSAATLKSLARKKAFNDGTTHAVSSHSGGVESKHKKRGRPKTLISFDDDEHFSSGFTDDGSDASSTRGADICTPTSAPAPRTGKLKFSFEDTTASSAVVPNRHRAHVSNYKAPKDRVIASYKGSNELQPLDNPNAHLRTVNEKVSSGQWEAQKAGLEIVRRLCLHHADVMAKHKEEVHGIVRSILGCVNNLRSQVAKNGLLCLQDMFRGLERSMDSEIKVCMDTIFKKCTDTNHFVNEEARKVMEAMVQHSSTTKVLTMCISAFSSHGNDPKMRAAIAFFICRSIEVLQDRLLQHKALLSTIQCVGKMLTDNAVATREAGKRSVFALASIEGMMDVVRRKLPKNHLEKFEKVLKSQPQSGGGMGDTSASLRTTHTKRVRNAVAGKTKKHHNKTSGAVLDMLPPIARDMASTDWRKRHNALQQLTDLIVDHPEVMEAQLFKLMDHFLTGLGDGNSKVNIRALEALCRVIPAIGDLTARVLHLLMPQVCKYLGSGNSNTKKYSQQVVKAIVNNVTVKDTALALSKALANNCKSVPSKAIILEEIAGLVIDCNREHPRLVTNKLLPQAVGLLSGTARNVRVQAEALVTVICKAGPEQATLKIQQLSPRSKSRAMVLVNAV